MLPVYISALSLFLWGLAATPISIGLAQKFRLLDQPGGRKTHCGTTPRGAGIVLWSGYILWTLFAGSRGAGTSYIATGASLIFVIGYMDDMQPLPSLARLFFHLAAAAWVISPLPIPLWQKALFIFWITGVTNAYNLIDGMDGLCLTMTLLTMLCAMALLGVATVWAPLSGLVFGVLLWNFPTPRTFLGDGGSTFLGYLCASYMAWDIFPGMFGQGIFFMAAALLLIGGAPATDTLIAMTRRILKKRSPFSPDRGHAHHKLQDAGLSKPHTLAVLGAAHIAMILAGFQFIGMNVF